MGEETQNPESEVRIMRIHQEVNNLPWDEASLEIKVEKLRRELIELRHLQQAVGQLRSDITNLQKHQHTEDGTIVIPLINNNFGGNVLGVGGVSRRDYLA